MVDFIPEFGFDGGTTPISFSMYTAIVPLRSCTEACVWSSGSYCESLHTRMFSMKQ